MKNELNKNGIFLLDTYMLDYCGIKVFFQVCGTTKDTVFLIELATKKTKYGIMLTKRIKPSKTPLIVRYNNVFSKSNYEVRPIDLYGKEFWLPIQIKYGDAIYEEAKQYNEYPPIGYAYAVPIKDILNKYWEEPEKIVPFHRCNLA